MVDYNPIIRRTDSRKKKKNVSAEPDSRNKIQKLRKKFNHAKLNLKLEEMICAPAAAVKNTKAVMVNLNNIQSICL